MIYPIYILSRGRYDKSLTANCLMEYNVPYTIFVEPQEEKQYKNKFGSDAIHIIPDNDQGIAYVRNYINDYSMKQFDKKHWQLDDNIKSFRRRINNKNVKDDPYILLTEAEQEVEKYSNIGRASLAYTTLRFWR